MPNIKLKVKIIEHFGSQIRFAMRLGVNDSIVSKVIHRYLVLSKEEQLRWAVLLNCKPGDVFTENNSSLKKSN